MNDSTANEVGMLTGQVVRITTGTRLHFGLLKTAAPFGGVGVMIDRPQTEVVIRPADSFDCPPEVAHRAVAIAGRIVSQSEQHDLPNCAIEIVKRAEAHFGLGSGTQLSLAIAEGLTRFCGLAFSPQDLACQIAGRGKRSAVGVHGYFQGGLIYEDADQPCELNAIKQRVPLADRWCVALYRPATVPPPVSGQQEQAHFHALEKTVSSKQPRLAAIIQQQLIPAAIDRDFAAFADAVQRYNYQSGLLFQSVQGGPYNGSAVTELVELLIRCGAAGVGQSSWGPTTFAWFEDTQRAAAFAHKLPDSVQAFAVANVLNRPRQLKPAR